LKIFNKYGITGILSIKQLLIRNLTLFILPIDVIILIFTNRRLGDILSKTSLIFSKELSNKIYLKIKLIDIIIWVIINILILLFLILINSMK